MTKKRITEIYRFLAIASMKRLNDEEKIALIRLLRQMKPVSQELGEAVEDAATRASIDGIKDVLAFVNAAIADIAKEETTIDTHIMTSETFDRLALSNEWCFGQIDELGDVLIKR